MRAEVVGRAARASASLGSVALAVLLPKCPLCVAAALSALGLGAGLSGGLAPLAEPVVVTTVVLAGAVFVRGEWRRRRRLPRSTGCPGCA